MGYHVQLISKTRDEKKQFKIWICTQSKGPYHLSYNFAKFQSRDFKNNELGQIEKILSLDLQIFRNYPANYLPNVGELEYQLYLAEEAGDSQRIAELKMQIETTNEEWEQNYDQINEGWTKVTDLRKVVLALIEKITQMPDFGRFIQVEHGWDYHWGDYFSLTPKVQTQDSHIMDDLQIILSELDCYELEGEQYAAFIGG